jgi:hypothetical protein
MCLHQLVYLASYRVHSGSVLEGTGHGYLGVAAPVLVALALCGIAGSIAAGASRSRTGTGRSRNRGWPAWAGLLLLIFGVQEAVELLVRTGSLDQLATLAETSGPLALTAAIGIGRLVGLALSGISALDATLAPPATRPPRAPVTLRLPASRSPLHFPRLTLAFGLARRPPPAAPA